MLAAGGRCVSLSALPRANALAVIRQASSSGSSRSNKEEPVAVSSPTGAVADSARSPMSQRPLPPDDGKVRTYHSRTRSVCIAASIDCFFAKVSLIRGMLFSTNAVLNMRWFVVELRSIRDEQGLSFRFRNTKDTMIHGT